MEDESRTDSSEDDLESLATCYAMNQLVQEDAHYAMHCLVSGNQDVESVIKNHRRCPKDVIIWEMVESHDVRCAALSSAAP